MKKEKKLPKVNCSNCEWSWNVKDGGDDLFTCHECGHINSKYDITEGVKLKVSNETPETITVVVQYNGRNAGIIMVAPSPTKEDTIEVVGIKFIQSYEELHIISDAVKSLWPLFTEANSIIVAPKPESIQFWNTLGFNRISPRYLIMNRGH